MKHSLFLTLALVFTLAACSDKKDELKTEGVAPSVDADKIIRKNEWCLVGNPQDFSSFNIPKDRQVIGRLVFSGYETSAGSVSAKWYAIKDKQAVTFPMEIKSYDNWVHTGPTPEVLTRSYGMIVTLEKMSGGSPNDIPLYSAIDNNALAEQPPFRLVIKSKTFKTGAAVAYPCSLSKIRFKEQFEQTSEERSQFQNYVSLSSRTGYPMPEMIWPFRAINLNSYWVADRTWCSIQSEDTNASEMSITRFNRDGSSSVWKIRTRNYGELLKYVYALPNADTTRNNGSYDYSNFQESGGALSVRTFGSTTYSTSLKGFSDGRGANVLMASSGNPLIECKAFRDNGGTYRIGRYVSLSGYVDRDGLTVEPGAELIYRALGF